jgi:hypothetical protein
MRCYWQNLLLKGMLTSYRADNGRFADAVFQQAIKDSNQKSHNMLLGHTIKRGLLSNKLRKLP